MDVDQIATWKIHGPLQSIILNPTKSCKLFEYHSS